MSRKHLNTLLLVLLLGVVGLGGVLRRDPGVPNREFIPEMVHTPRFNAFAANPNFADGKTLREPQPGTIPRGALPLPYAATPEDALRAGEELANPVPADDQAAVERGARVYANFCVVCHGPAGQGDGPVSLHGFPAPPSLLTERSVRMKDGQLFHILTFGQKNMPGYAAQISREDRWKAVRHVRALQKKAPARPGGAR